MSRSPGSVPTLEHAAIVGVDVYKRQVVLRDAEKIVPVGFPQVKGYSVYVLLYYIAAKACILYTSRCV